MSAQESPAKVPQHTLPGIGLNYDHPFSLAVNPNTNMVYVTQHDTHSDHGKLSVINGKTNTTIDTIGLGGQPTQVAVNPITDTIYTVNTGHIVTHVHTIHHAKYVEGRSWQEGPTQYMTETEANGNVSVINGSTNRIENVSLTIGNYIVNPFAIAVNPKTNTVCVMAQLHHLPYVLFTRYLTYLLIIDLNTNKVKTFLIDRRSSYEGNIAVNPVTNKIYVTSNPDGVVSQLSVIDGNTDKVQDVTLGVVKKRSEIKTHNQEEEEGKEKSPNGIAVNPTTNKIYIIDHVSNTISVVNGATNKVATINTGTSPNGIAVNPTTNKIYVINHGSNTTSVVDGTTDRVTGIINLEDSPTDIAVNPNTNLVYVTNLDDKSLSVIDGNTNKLLIDPSTVHELVQHGLAQPGIIVGNRPNGIAVNPNTNLVYVANSRSNTVSVIDGETDKTLKNITVGRDPVNLAVDTDTNLVYVTNEYSHTLSVIDGTTNYILDTIPLGITPYNLAIVPDDNFVYVTDAVSNVVSLIDGLTDKVIANLTVGEPPKNSPAGSIMPIANYTVGKSPISLDVDRGTPAIGGRIYVTDPHFNKMTEGFVTYTSLSKHKLFFNGLFRTPVGGSPAAVKVYQPLTVYGYGTIGYSNLPIPFVANSASDTVSIVGNVFPPSLSFVSNITVGISPVDLAVNTQTNTVYVANQGSNSVSVINYTYPTHEGSVFKTVDLGYSPFHMAVNPKTNMVYVTSNDSNTISVINGTSNTLVLGMTFNVNSPNLGDIYCNGKKVSTVYARYDIGTDLNCKAVTRMQNESITGFQAMDNFLWEIHDFFAGGIRFISWSGDIPQPNQTNHRVMLTLYKFGTMTANFVNTPPVISEAYLTTFLAIGIPVIGAAIYKKRDWLYKKHKGYLNKYAKKIDQNKEECLELLGNIRTQVIDLFLSEEIDKSDYKILERKFEEYINKLNRT